MVRRNVGIALCAFVACRGLAQSPEDFALTLELTRSEGTQHEVLVIGSWTADGVLGWSYGVCHNPAEALLDGWSYPSDIANSAPAGDTFDYMLVTLHAGGITQAAMTDYTVAWSLGARPRFEMLALRYQRQAEAAALGICGTLGAPPVDVVYCVPEGDGFIGIMPAAQKGLVLFDTSTHTFELNVSNVQVSPSVNVGDPFEVTWDLTNVGTVTPLSWQDTVVLSSDQVWDSADLVLGRFTHDVQIGAGETQQSCTLRQQLGPMPAGEYYVLVSSIGSAFATSPRFTLGWNVPVLDLSGTTTASRFTAEERARYFRFAVGAGHDVVVSLNDLDQQGINELYVRRDDLPTRTAYDIRHELAGRASHVIYLPLTNAGTYYVMAYGSVLPEGVQSEFTMSAAYVVPTITSLTPDHCGNTEWAKPSVRIQGAGFRPHSTVVLARDGYDPITPESVFYSGSTRMTARFNLVGRTAGTWALVVANSAHERAEAAFLIEEGGTPKLETRVLVPDVVGFHRNATLWIHYRNSGLAPMPAPLLRFHGSHNALLTVDPTKAGPGLWTDSPPPYLHDTVQVLGIGKYGDPSILNPGEGGLIPVYYRGLKEPWDWSYPRIEFTLGVVNVGDTEPIDWQEVQTAVKPDDADAATWPQTFATLQANVGTTWGDYVARLLANARTLWVTGTRTYEVLKLFDVELDKAYGRPRCVIAGTVVLTADGSPLSNTTIVAKTADGAGYGSAAIAGGAFAIVNVPPGRYELAVEGYYFSDPVEVDVTNAENALDLQLAATPAPPDVEVPSQAVPDVDPLLTTDANGRLQLTWRRGGELWHGVFDGAAWQVQASGGLTGSAAAAAWGGIPAAGGAPGTVVVWESGAGNDARIFAALAVVDAGGQTTWTVPVPVGVGDVACLKPTVCVLESGAVLVTWLKRDWSVQDDTDVYWSVLPGLKGAWQPPVVPEIDEVVEPDSKDDKFCLWYRFEKGTQLPLVPVICGTYKYEVYGQACGTPGCTLKIAGLLDAKVQIADRFYGKGKVQLEGSWRTDREDCAYVFDAAKLTGGFGVQGDLPVYPFQVPAILKAEVGARVTGMVDGTLIWRGVNFPSWPTDAKVALTVGFGPYGKVEFFNKMVTGDVSGIGEVKFVHDVLGTRIASYAIKLTFKGCGGFGLVCASWEHRWCWGECGKDGEPGWRTWKKGDVTMAEKSSKGLELFQGTGAVYGGTTLLSDVSSDLLHDGGPAVAPGGNGAFCAWTKDSDPRTTIGAALVVAEFDGATWTPAVVDPAGSFNRDPALAVDTAGTPVVLWARATADGITLDSTVDELLAAADRSDVFFSRRVAGAWTAPSTLGALDGSDYAVAAAAGPAGTVLAAWLHTDTDGTRVFAALWDGTTWSAPVPLTTASACQRPTCGYVGDRPVVAWAQDTDGDEETPQDLTVFYSTFTATWSTATALEKEVLPATPKRMEAKGRAKWEWRPPDTCCDCPQGDRSCDDDDPNDLPDPPSKPGGDGSSDSVGSCDPNLKEATADFIRSTPEGVVSGRYVASDSEILYTIYFENKAAAEAAAMEVRITDALPAGLDWTSVELKEIAFGKNLITAPSGVHTLARRVPIAGWTWTKEKGWYTGATPLFVDVLADLDLETGILSWSLLACDVTTGLWPEDARAGFLPPSDPALEAGSGQGFVTFTVRPRSELVSGEEIANEARIVFDFNPPIDTPKVALIVDSAAPASSVRPFAHSTTWDTEFTVTWGEDGSPDTSGVAVFEVYYSVDGQGYELWTTSTAPSALFTGPAEHTYSFYSIARDNVGHAEQPPTQPGGAIAPDATITVTWPRFMRGDVNADKQIDIADPIRTLSYLFGGAPHALCDSSADANDDGKIDIADPIFLLAYLFAHATPPAAPFRACGTDPTSDVLGCKAFPPCQ